MDKKELLDLIDKARNDGATEISLYGQQLTEFPVEVCTLTKLTTLKLGWNAITAIPPEIGNLTNLTDLYLGGNRIGAIPPEIGNLTNLTVLELGNNLILEIPKELGNLSKLAALYLNNNQIETIPPEIGNLSNLTGLHLNYNRIKAVPPEIGRLTKLIVLDLGNNQIKTLPRELGKLTNLNRLYLPKNQLAELPLEIGNLTDLVTIEFYANPLVNIPPALAKAGGKAVIAYLADLKTKRRERIAVVFNNNVWGHLFPIERALEQTLGDRYIIQKSADRIAVSLEAAGQLQGALDAVIPVLAAFEGAAPGEMKSVEIERMDRPPEKIEGKDLKDYLGDIGGRMDKLLDEKDRSIAVGAIGPESAKAAPPDGQALAAWLAGFDAGRQTLAKDIYQPFKRFFAAVKGLPKLP